MRSLKIILGAFLTCIMFAFSSGDKVPKKVADAFAKKFPTAKKIKWEKESKTEWEAEFKMNNVEYSANFLEDGTWKETEHEIDKKDIPQKVKAGLMSAFPGYEIEEAEISETSKGMVYEFEIEKDEQEMEVSVDQNGKVLSKEIKSENEEEDND